MIIDHKPVTAVWEITMACNMRCKHCGSSCENKLPGELTTGEALKLCDELAELGLSWITLSGGEPTTRNDWDLIANRLNERGIIPTMITNGWLMTEEIAKRAKRAGVNTIAISLDGLQKTHDFIRKEGSYERIMKAIGVIVKEGLHCSIITTINNLNIHELDAMHDILSKLGLFGWQLQLGLPMGNMAANQQLVSTPNQVDEVIDFAYRVFQKDGLEIQLSDCIGYFNNKEIEIRNKSKNSNEYLWVGCNAGKYNFGILHNGDVVGCTSIRDQSFIEGNVKQTHIRDLWYNPGAFLWSRGMAKEKLKGVCQKCLYGARCLGGCGNTRLTMEGSIYSENRYCSYHLSVKKAMDQLEKITDIEEMLRRANKFAEANYYQLAEILLSNLLQIEPANFEALRLYGFVSYKLGNYQEAKKANEFLIGEKPDDPYINKGYGLTIAKLGEVERGIDYLRRAIELSGKKYTDPYFDLAVLLSENNRFDEAFEVLEEGRNISKDFVAASEDLYQSICARANPKEKQIAN